jgi:arylsulfatase A-like enzyme
MLAALEAHGMAENTILLFTSDHGDYLGSHGRVQKGDLHEESVRIPFLVRWPAGLTPRTCETQVASSVQVAPTLLALAGIPIPGHMAGSSLSPVLRGEVPVLAAEHAIIESGSGVGVRTPTHLYGLPFEHGRTLAARPHYFFDVQSDPYQLNNLSNSVGQNTLASGLDSILREWDASTPWMTA